MQPSKFKLLLFPLMILAIVFGVQSAHAGKVVKIKGKKIYIKLDPNEVAKTSQGDRLYVMTSKGKKKGYVIVKKMKGRLVIAKKGKGKVRKGYKTKLRKKKKKGKKPLEKMEDASEVAEVDSDPADRSDMMFGIMGSFGTATQNVDGIVDMSGSTTSVRAVFDYELFSDLGVQSRLGIEQLSVSGADTANVEYETIISYIALDLLLRYYVYRGNSFGFYVTGGMGIYSPMSTDLKGGSDPNNPGAIQEDSISTTSLLNFGAGVSIPFSGWEIQLGGEYLYFPPSDDVDTTVINGKLALMFEI